MIQKGVIHPDDHGEVPYFVIRGLVMSASAYIKSIFSDKSEIAFSGRKHPSLKEFPKREGIFFFPSLPQVPPLARTIKH